MTGCVIPRRGIYYVRLTYYDMNHRRRDKWVSTGLSGRGAKQKATAMIDQMIEQYSYLETNAHPTKMAEYLLMWKEIRRTEVAVMDKFAGIITGNGGEIVKQDEWGKRKLAYAIDYKTEGFYVLVTFNAPADLPRELERNFRNDERVLRYMVTRKEA